MKYKLLIEYLGKDFSGWQSQPGKRTVQGEIEKVLAELLHEKVILSASGRTDKGVNAFGQVASFESSVVMTESKLRGALNAFLPEDIAGTLEGRKRKDLLKQNCQPLPDRCNI